MKTITAKWFECTVQYERMTEEGTQKKVTELYVVNALSFTEAEARIIEEMSPFISGDFEVVGIKPAQYKEIAFMTDGEAVLNNETNKLMHALQVGKGEEQFKEHTDFNRASVESHFYKMKVAFTTLDEKTMKEKMTNTLMLIEGCSLHDALDGVDNVLKGSMVDYISVNAVSTKIVDVFAQSADEKKADELRGNQV